MKSSTIFDYPLFALGFRAFFGLAGLSALILIVLWNAIFKGELTLSNYFADTYWHAHEMLLGYSVAVIAGFLLTAVKNWTGRPTLTGDQLAGLCLLWLYGRIVPFYAGLLPDALIALIDFSFLPALAYQISKPIMQAKHYRSLIFIGLLLLLALGNGLIHAEILGLQENSAWPGIQVVVGNYHYYDSGHRRTRFSFFYGTRLAGNTGIKKSGNGWPVDCDGSSGIRLAAVQYFRHCPGIDGGSGSCH